MRGKINAGFGPNRHWRWLQSAVTSRGQIFLVGHGRGRPAPEPVLDLGESSTARARGPSFNGHASNEMFRNAHSTATQHVRDQKDLIHSNVPELEQMKKSERSGLGGRSSLSRNGSG